MWRGFTRREAEWGGLFGEALGFEPEEAIGGPGVMIAGGLAGAEAHSVAAFLVDMEIEGDARFAECGGKFEGVFDFDGVVFPSVPDETRGSLFGDLFFVG